VKVGDKVDVMIEISYSCTMPTWSSGWTIEIISGDWALIMKEEEWEYPMTQNVPPIREVRKKAELAMLRLSTPIPKRGVAEKERLPKPGAGVMFKVPNSFGNHWTFGLVVQPNKKSIKVLHGLKLINRNFDQFIEVIK
jgi:hypothetical protein